jgi:outer membrane protein assembly factor BamD (BamD/ComL family)
LSRFRLIVLAATCLAPFLAACASAPVPAEPPQASQVAAPEPVPELTLNLPAPESATDCNCDAPADAVDPTFLDKGLAALNAGDFKEAVNYFRRYQRLESSAGVDWEAEIAIAYVKMLPQSPYYNWRASRDSYLRLMRQVPQGMKLHEKIVLMRDTLTILVDLHTQIDDLQRETATLSESLEKREEALRRLRELTLGQ